MTRPRPLFQQIWHGKSEELCEKFKPKSVDCIVTDPPFGVDNQSNQATTESGKKYARKIANDESPEIAIKTFQDVMNVLLPKTKDDCDAYVFTSYQVLSDWLVMLDNFMGPHGFRRKAVLVWEKDGPGMGDTENPWGMGCEFIMQYRKGSFPKLTKRRNAVLHVPQVRPDQLIHPHEKPLPLLELLLKASTRERDFVVDPFGGSCSTARACKAISRSCVCIEYDEYNAAEAQKSLETREESLFG